MLRKQPLPGSSRHDPVQKLDRGVAAWLVDEAHSGAVEKAGTVVDLSDQEPLYAVAAGVLAAGALLRDGPTWRLGTRVLASHLLATALRGIAKQLVDRTRPEAAVRRGSYVLREGRRHEKDFNSFPSGHTAGAITVARSIAIARPEAATPAMALAAGVGIAQVLRSRHFVSDVVAGAAIGWLSAEAIEALIARAAKV